MQIAPRYDGAPILAMDGPEDDQLVPFVRQRERLLALLDGLTDEQWATDSRCADWTVRDVVAHLVTVDEFWRGSLLAGVAGEPTRILPGFDPAATPPLLLGALADLGPDEVLDRFRSTSRALLDVVEGLDDWSVLAESPAGHVPARLVVQHGLWDAWVHERDIGVPLGLEPTVEPDEVRSCLRYAAAISPVLGAGTGQTAAATLGLEATDPSTAFVIEVGESVTVRDGTADGLPCLRGDAVALTEALSLRAPLPATAPPEWSALLGGLRTAFT